ncbi:uncharacterized protein LOC124356000 [Homalodisca vitripennis]|uniref:uncharacterized protein LOC124356000 n=1 Tax=Homalodisca vitripennis TaxID=197043 RepID=UPI001EECA9A0|nr:uncharacterized protein LOC124356000 [Homalodisca vitripennis]
MERTGRIKPRNKNEQDMILEELLKSVGDDSEIEGMSDDDVEESTIVNLTNSLRQDPLGHLFQLLNNNEEDLEGEDQGKGTNLPMAKEMGLGPAVVVRLKESIPPLSVLYFDRYFTTISLMEKLIAEQFYATGTMMTNRLREIRFNPEHLKRGQYEERVSPDGKLVALKWMDNNSVVILSSVCGSQPVTLVQRWSKKESVYINFECPAAIVTYNKNMGGVDLLNQLIEVLQNLV